MGIPEHNAGAQFAALAEVLTSEGIDVDDVKSKLKTQEVETPSWGYGNSGTRFGVFPQPGAARDVHERLSDAAQVHKVTGVCPGVALHIPWDKVDDYDALQQEAARRAGTETAGTPGTSAGTAPASGGGSAGPQGSSAGGPVLYSDGPATQQWMQQQQDLGAEAALRMAMGMDGRANVIGPFTDHDHDALRLKRAHGRQQVLDHRSARDGV